MTPNDRSTPANETPAPLEAEPAQEDLVDEGGNVSVLLMSFHGRNHAQAAQSTLDNAKKHTGWEPLFLIHAGDHSGLYWGRYDTQAQAEPFLRRAKEYVAPSGESVFRGAILLPLPGRDLGPDQYNLLHAQGAYSVLVAVFQDIPERHYLGRKKRAVELCRKLRQQGKEAYFYHDEVRSGVTIGTFPASAVKTRPVRKRHPQTGDTFIQHVKYIDSPEMKALVKEYPELLYCGNTEIRTIRDPKTGKLVRKVQGSMPISISEIRR